MFKFIHAADIHLDSPMHRLERYEGAPLEEFRQATRRAFENLISLAESENATFVLIAGDLYDGDWKDYNTGLYFVRQMTRLQDAGIPVFIAAGNHDAESKISRGLKLPDNVTLFPSDRADTRMLDKIGVAIHGRSFATPAEKNDLSRGYPEAIKGCFNIGLLHTCVTGRTGHESYAPCSLKELRAKGYGYWALGHVHNREILHDDPPVVFSGNIQGRNIRETGPRGCMLVTVDDKDRPTPEFRSLDVVRWDTLTLLADTAENGYDVIRLFEKDLADRLAANADMPMAVRVCVLGRTSAHNELLADMGKWTNEIRATALGAGSGNAWVEKVHFATAPTLSEQCTATGAMGALEALLDEMASDPKAFPDLAADLRSLEAKLPPELKSGENAFQPDDPEWLRAMLSQVRPMLIRRLLGKGGA